jgi:hypothetical protein
MIFGASRALFRQIIIRSLSRQTSSRYALVGLLYASIRSLLTLLRAYLIQADKATAAQEAVLKADLRPVDEVFREAIFIENVRESKRLYL